jgi:predicted DNA-binding ribbon-helix-helix protein
MAPMPIESAAASARPVKHSFTISGHRTSISLEQAFWDALRTAAAAERVSVAALVARIDRARGGAGLSSAVRVWVLGWAARGGLARASRNDADNSATGCRCGRTD